MSLQQAESQLKAAAHPLILPDGTQWMLSPLTDKDITELDNWVKRRYLFDQRSNIPEDADEETKERIERVAQQTASTLCWYLGYGASIMASIDGMTQLVLQSAKRNHPELTYDIVHEKLLSQGAKALNFANETINEANNAGAVFENLKKSTAKKKKSQMKKSLR